MNQAEVYKKLAAIAESISQKSVAAQTIMNEIHELKTQEADLHAAIGLSTNSPEAPKANRVRTSVEDIASIRRKAISIMRESGMWMPLSTIADEVTQMFPHVERLTVEQQIRALVNIPNSKVWHNGKRARASMYRWADVKPE